MSGMSFCSARDMKCHWMMKMLGTTLNLEDLEGELAQDELEVGDDGTDGEGEEPVNSESDKSEGEEDDGIIADEGEELNEDIWAWEGYGAL